MSILFFLLFLPFQFSNAFILTMEERILKAIQSGFSHEPWRNDTVIVLHWDFSYPRHVLEDFVEKHKWNMEMVWNRDLYKRMQLLYQSYSMFEEGLQYCKAKYKACKKKYDKVQCEHCDGNIMSGDVKEYLKLLDMNIPLYDRMIIKNYKE